MAVKRLTAIVSAVGALALTGQAAAAAGTGLTRVSGPSPYADCQEPQHGATVYINAEVEPQLAANPHTAGNLVGAWQQDRYSTGGSHGLVAGYSFDSGRSWGESTLPFDRCAPGGLGFERSSDPWVSIGPDGTAYAVGLSLSNPNSGPNAIVTATSADGGKTWGTLRVVQFDIGAAHFNDKESITADPAHPGVAYVVWDRSLAAPSGHFRIPTYFSRTTDWGRTWSAPRAIAATGMDEQSIGNVILANPTTHRLYDFYTFFFCTCVSQAQIQYVTSDDEGLTWGDPHIVNVMDAIPVTDPNTGQLLRTEDFTSTQAIDPVSGALYVAWQTPRFSNGAYDEIAFTSSADGVTWNPEVRVNTPTGRAAFTPTIAVNNGVVGLTYYDLRHLAPHNTTTLPTDLWFRSSRDMGATWSSDQHVAGPFDMLAAPVSAGRGFFIGDYQGLTGSGDDFVPFFVKTNCAAAPCTQNRTDVYSAQVEPAASGAALPAASSGALRPVARPTARTD